MKISLPTIGGKPEVVEDRGEGAVDVERDRLDRVRRAPLRAHARTGCRRRPGRRPRRGRRARRRAGRSSECTRCPKPGSRAFAGFASSTSCRATVVERQRRAPRTVEPRRDQLHAASTGAAVLVADGEHAGGDRGGQRLRGCPMRRAAPPRTTARRRRDRRRRSGCASSRRRSPVGRQPLVMQQEDQIGERRLPHQVEDVVSANSDVVGPASTMAVRQGVHSSGWILRPCRVTAVLLR